ncbi:hypothetical protein CRPA5_46230 [Pseudomonas aeruginosa]
MEKFEHSRIGVCDHDLIHTKVQRVHLGKLFDRQHGHPGIESASLTKEERRNDRVTQFGIPTGYENVQAFFRASGLWQPVGQETKYHARDYSAKIPQE